MIRNFVGLILAGVVGAVSRPVLPPRLPCPMESRGGASRSARRRGTRSPLSFESGENGGIRRLVTDLTSQADARGGGQAVNLRAKVELFKVAVA